MTASDLDGVTATTAAERAVLEENNPWQRYGWLMAVVWLGFLYYPAAGLVKSTAPEWLVALGWVCIAVFATSYLGGFIFGMRAGWHKPSRLEIGLFFTAIASALLTLPALGTGIASYLPFLMAYASYVLGKVWHWVTCTAAVVLGAAEVIFALATGRDAPFTLLAIIVIMFAVNSINVWLISRSVATDELRIDLATSEQREAIARDVHDLLGHSLTVVKLKAELAARLIEKDPAAARTELEEIARLTGEAIAGVRGTVTGLRSSGLTEQLVASRSALESAGVLVTVSGESASLSPAQSLPAAWILREATTNVLRHADAKKVTIELAPGTMVIEDDGGGLEAGVGAGDAGVGASGAVECNGLRGMAERAAAAGATLTVGAGGTVVAGGAAADRPGTRVALTW